MSLHIAAKPGEVADRVLLPGDPLRARYIAENFLKDSFCYNNVRGMLGFTGTWKGKRVSVQGTGMGVGSIGIYAYELINFHGARRLIRTGSCGSLLPEFALRDVVIAQAAATDSGTDLTRFGIGLSFPHVADFGLLREAVGCAEAKGVSPKVTTVFSSDLFYGNETCDQRYKVLTDYGVGCVEMECAELFALGSRHKVQTLGVLTVSDLMYCEGVACSSQEREQSFNSMIELALDTV